MDARDQLNVSSNADLLEQLARLMALPESTPQSEWRAATVVMYGESGKTVAAQVSHVQDLELDISEVNLLRLAVSAIREHLERTS